LFLLPFLGQLSGLGGFFLFHIPYYILLGSWYLIGLITGYPALDIGILLYLR
jgi:hypothetical protein